MAIFVSENDTHPQFTRIFQAGLFLYVVSISLFIPMVSVEPCMQALLTLTACAAGITIYYKNPSLFVPALFFLIHTVLFPISIYILKRYAINFPQLYFLPSIIIYVAIILKIHAFRTKVTWLNLGRLDKLTVALMFSMSLLTALSLLIWAVFIKKDLSEFQAFIPDIPLSLLMLYGLMFPLFNALFEEFMARAVLYDGFYRLFKNIGFVILWQAVVFSLWHVQGFPGGVVGVVMVFIWSVLLGAIRYRSGGMLAPYIAHVLADLSIALIVFALVIFPQF